MPVTQLRPRHRGVSGRLGISRSTAARRPLLGRHPGRVIVVALGVLAILNLGVVMLIKADTTPVGSQLDLPAAIDSIAPEAASIVNLQATIAVDLDDAYTGVLVLDGVEIPETELDRVVGLAQVSFRPGPGRGLAKLSAGEHTVVVRYWPRGEPRPARPASYSWRFRASA